MLPGLPLFVVRSLIGVAVSDLLTLSVMLSNAKHLLLNAPIPQMLHFIQHDGGATPP